ncbi:MAG: TnpV protein [Christensenellaceae bacterium]
MLYPLVECQPDNSPLTKFGLMRMEYLKESHPATYNKLIAERQLRQHCKEIEDEALEQMQIITERLRKEQKPPQTEDFMEMTRYNNQLRMQAEELVIAEFIQI